MDRLDFEQLVQEGIALIPKKFLDRLSNVAVIIEDEPTHEQLRKLKIRGDTLLLGLYEGIPQTQRYNYNQALPDKLTIFQKAIEELANGDIINIREIVKNTVWHEIAHHFGLDEVRVRKAEIRRKHKK